MYSVYTKNKRKKGLSISQMNITYNCFKYKPCFGKSYYEKDTENNRVECYINLNETPILVGSKKL